MPKFCMVLSLLLFAFTATAQTSLIHYGPARISGTTIFEAPMLENFYLNQTPNGMNGLFADASCALCPSGQQSVAENFTVSDSIIEISKLVMWGGYYPENIPNPVDDFTVILHSDNGGTPGPVLDIRSGLQASSRAVTGNILFGVDEYVFTFEFWDPIYINNTGMYWIEIYNNSTASGNFFWETGYLDFTQGIPGSSWTPEAPGATWNLDWTTDLSMQLQVSGFIRVTTAQITDDVIRGALNQPVICIIVNPQVGVLTPPSITAVSLNTNGTTNTGDILNAKLFNTGTNPNFSTLNQTGNTVYNPDGYFTIYGGGSLIDYETNYIWLTYDVSPTAQIGNFLDAECLQLTFSYTGPRVPDITAPAGNREIIMGNGLSGIYTVGNTGDFNSLTSLCDSLEASFITGPVTIEILNDYISTEENFPIVFPFIIGSSFQNSIKIHPAFDANDVAITGSQNAIIKFDGATNISIDGRPGGIGEEKSLSVINENPNGSTILITGNSRNIEISYCNILGCSDNPDRGVIQSFYNGYNSYSDSVSIDNCFIGKSISGRPDNGIYFGDGSYPVALHWIISECQITDFLSTGINCKQAGECYIQDSEIYLTEPTNKAKVTGIFIGHLFSPNIIRNSIHSLSTLGSSPDSVTGIKIPNSSNAYIYNNFISLSGDENSTIAGIDFSGIYFTYNNFFNNSIYIYGEEANSNNSFCFRRRSAEYHGMTLNLLDNIFVNKRNNTSGTGRHYAIAIEDDRGLQQIDHNDYFAAGNGGILGKWLNNDITTLTVWKDSTQKDTFSISKNVYFTSGTDLHLTGSSLGDIDLTGEPLSLIPDDIDREIRNPSFPYIGADENLGYPLPVELISFTVLSSESEVGINWITASERNNKGFEIERRRIPEQMQWMKIGFVPGSGTTTEPKLYSFTDKNVTTGKYFYRLKQIDFDGSYNYSKIVDVELTAPDKFSLEQNFPNPFNPATTINYQLPKSGYVTLKVYNILGREVATLVNEQKTQGRYSVNFNASRLASGVYFYRIKAGDFIQTEKMILLR